MYKHIKLYLLSVLLLFMLAFTPLFADITLSSITLISPENDSWWNETSIDFEWDIAYENVDHYNIGVSTNNFASYIYYVQVTNPFKNFTLSQEGYYKWKVEAFDSEGKSTSAVSTFGIDMTPPDVTLDYPINGIKLSSTTVTLTWTVEDNLSGMLEGTYQLLISTSIEDISYFIGDLLPVSSGTSYTEKELLEDETIYYWLLTVYDKVYNMTDSSISSFSIRVPSRLKPDPDSFYNILENKLVLNFTKQIKITSIENVFNNNEIWIQKLQAYNGVYNPDIVISISPINDAGFVTTEDSTQIEFQISNTIKDKIAGWEVDQLWISINDNIEDINEYLISIPKTDATQINFIKDNSAPVIIESSLVPQEDSVNNNPGQGIIIKAKFNENIKNRYGGVNITPLDQVISVTAIKNNLAQDINEMVTGDVSFNDNFELVFIPIPTLKYNHYYKVEISTQVLDTSGNYLAEKRVWYFKTVMNDIERNICQSKDLNFELSIPENFMSNDGYVDINLNALEDPVELGQGIIQEANAKKEQETIFSVPLLDSIVEFNLYKTSGEKMETSNASGNIQISVKYIDEDDDGYLDNLANVMVKTLKMYKLNTETKQWEEVPDSFIDTEKKVITAYINSLSVFCLIGAPDYDLSRAYAYPVPFKPSEGHMYITFTNLASVCKINVYNIAGELVKTIEHTNGLPQLLWDVTSNRGNQVFSGVYVYIKNL